jgi:7,8-dihydroneopterin aldolase/epimerase/oxygenase
MHSAERDAIHIEQLELFARIGVTDDERERPQRLTVSITVWPNEQFDHLGDDVARAVDYSVVSAAARDFVAGRSDKLIETLAEALASYLLGMFRIRQVQIELRKFALPDAQYAAAIVIRSTSVG